MKFTNLLLVAVLCVSITWGLRRQQGPPKWHQLTADYSFEQYMQDFHKPYTTGSVEWFERKGLFEASLKRILAHNADASQSYKKGVNQFTDLTEDERRLRTSMFPNAPLNKMARSRPTTTQQHRKLLTRNVTTPLPVHKTVDYRLHVPPVLTTVKDQGYCGSCWSFGTTEAIETQYALQFGKLHVLSEQQLVSCAPIVPYSMDPFNSGTLGGCDGYFPHMAVQYLVEQGGGMTTEWMNPYTAHNKNWWEKVDPCRKTVIGGNFVNVTGYTTVQPNNQSAFKETLQNVGPIAVIMFVTTSFEDYESGVYSDPACLGNDQMFPSHIVLLVGYGHDADLGKDYWIVRNSWDSNWGEDGYFRLLREETQEAVDDVCGIMPLPDQRPNALNGTTTYSNVTACGTCGILGYGLVPTVDV